ncbi:hypothetical protein [Flavobacterium sp.]|uniref:hypothetical protein n=1 Tax=Flavobacterium sp. TaxID=239 RepID=UPI002FDAA9FB
MKKNSLSRNDRGVKHFLYLKKDFENDVERLSISLPLFVRIMFLDEPNTWVKEINRFDFIRLAALDHEFGNLDKEIRNNFKYCSKFDKSGKQFKEIDLDSFFRTIIAEIDNHTYNVQEFILGVAYNGGLHMLPEKHKKEKYGLLYNSLLEPYPESVIEIIIQITKILIEIFDEFYSLLVGNNDGHSSNQNFKPLIAKDGKILEGIYFSKSYIQFPIRAKKNMGIRFCLELKFLQISINENNVIFEYGHQDNKKFRVQLFQVNTFLILKIISPNNSKTIKTIIDDQHHDKFAEIEISIYPSGKIVFAINGLTKHTDDLEENVEIIDGKLILGSNLTGTSFGEFYVKTITVQSIDRVNEMRVLNAYSLRLLKLKPQNIDYRLIKREFI